MKTWYQDIDKEAWGEGPWLDEPDKVQWVDEGTGLDCLMVRHSSSGHWCGYVGVPPGHPFHGVWYRDCPEGCGEDLYCEHKPDHRLDVHGSLTFSGSGAGVEDEDDPAFATSICHVPEEGRHENVWWLGFDCAHHGDRSPAWGILGDGLYRNEDYVREETARLAAQLGEMA